jgi:hypothetical protein
MREYFVNPDGPPSPLAGRRARVFMRLIERNGSPGVPPDSLRLKGFAGTVLIGGLVRPITYRAAYAALATSLRLIDGRDALRELPLGVAGRTPMLHTGLQDLANELMRDIHDALVGFDSPTAYYPGADPPAIEPVPDTHVAVVITAMQRELDLELRPKVTTYGTGGPKLPAAPLAQLPWQFQRALVERRRLRYAQFGITPASWKCGAWSLWAVPEDPDWLPRG